MTIADAKTPIFGGTTGGLLSAAEREEKYCITWTGKAGQVFEMPTSGAAVMVEGTNCIYLPRKETCLALGAQLRDYKIKDYKIYRILPGEEPVLVHPKDGVFPEKSNEGREMINKVDRNLGNNPEPVTVKFSDRETYDP
ncbi:photosystem I reaction center subunit II PsaD [Synechococcus sp. PCC 7336]|uniref:photosystem I reaction center subunit II PsaD n=1 Tax=Synechococcus sp. PCC 7336 TaxID=195250 RepID=UPI00034D6561|nr:photosystem I reaction center subunit II PsaD [Synechococcus sp. PCC 7336]